MAVSTLQLLNHRGAATISANGTTLYYGVGIGSLLGQGTESQSQVVFRSPGTFWRLKANITANTASTTATIRLRKNGSNVNNTLSIPSGTTGTIVDVTNYDQFAPGDKIDVSIVVATGTGSITVNGVSVQLSTDYKMSPRFSNLMGASVTTASATRYAGVGGTNNVLLTSEIPTVVRVAGAHKNLAVSVIANTKTSNTVITSRKNGADGNMSVTIPGSTSGVFVDSTNSDSIAVGDTVAYKVALGNTGTIIFDYISSDLETSDNKIQYIARSDSSFLTGDSYAPLAGDAQNATESVVQYPFPAGTFSQLSIQVLNVNFHNNNIVVYLRLGGSNTALTITIPTSTTGTFVDSSNTVVCADGDLIDYFIDATGSGFFGIEVCGVVQTPYLNSAFR